MNCDNNGSRYQQAPLVDNGTRYQQAPLVDNGSRYQQAPLVDNGSRYQQAHLIRGWFGQASSWTQQGDPDYGLTESYHRELSNFLEELDYMEHGVPDFVFSYYDEQVGLLDRLYHQWECQTPGQTDGITLEGEQHLAEYAIHCYQADQTHCHLVASTESWPCQEPFHQGAPLHCSYAAVKVPYNMLPLGQLPEDGDWSQISHKGVFLGQDDLVPMIIGKAGCFLKQLTQECGLHYVWFDPNPLGLSHPTREDGVFQIWGRADLVPYAQARLQTHIQQTINQIWYNQVEAVGDNDTPSFITV